MKGYIYRYYNTITNKSYIGQTTDLVNRKSSHKTKSVFVKNKFYNAVRKYGWESFVFSILTTVGTHTVKLCNKVLDHLEILYIKEYNSYNNGYNSTEGGHCPRGLKRSKEYIEYCKNRTYSRETRAKMSKAASNRKISDETREKHRQNAIKRNFAKYRELTTEKRNASIREALAKQILQLDTNNNIINEFPSIRETVNYILLYIAPHLSKRGIEKAIIRHCKGKTKKEIYYGFVWKYKTECLT